MTLVYLLITRLIYKQLYKKHHQTYLYKLLAYFINGNIKQKIRIAKESAILKLFKLLHQR